MEYDSFWQGIGGGLGVSSGCKEGIIALRSPIQLDEIVISSFK
jgi:hypothetical protein